MRDERKAPAPKALTDERVDAYRRRRPFALPIVALSFFAVLVVVWNVALGWEVEKRSPEGGALKLVGLGLLGLGYVAGAWLARCPHCGAQANLVRGFDPTSCWKCHARLR